MLLDLARPGDDPGLRRLLRETPMDGSIRLTLERDPDCSHAAAVEGDLHQILVARDAATELPVAMGSRSVRTAWVNGVRRPVGYLSQLRVHPSFRGRPALLRRGYRRLRELHRDGRTRFYVTTIVTDNLPARRLLETDLRGFPTYRPWGTLVTLALEVRRRRRGATEPQGLGVASGDADSIDDVVACLERFGRRHQLAPCWTAEDLASPETTRGLSPEDFRLARRGGRVVGCLALWDQRGFKQVVVQGYDRVLSAARPLWNLAAPWIGTPRLPVPGAHLRMAFLSHLAVDGDDPDVFRALLAAARDEAARRGLDLLTLGLAAGHPLLPVARRSSPCREYASRIYLVHWEDGAEAVAALDGRLPHLEVAVL